MSIYTDWGLTGSPFSTDPLPGSGRGARLLVGRDTEVNLLIKRLYTPPKMATIEGMNGMGKTSLAMVTAYKSFQHHISTGQGPAFVPCENIFQLRAGYNIDDLLGEVYFKVSQTIVEQQKKIQQSNPALSANSPIRRWLNLPTADLHHGDLMKMTGNHDSGTFSPIYRDSNFKRVVSDWLREIFPRPDDGAIVCILDNLELLKDSSDARKYIEELRDPLKEIPGLRWVLCGSHGIVQGVAKSPRMEGHLHNPIQLGPISKEFALDIFRKRVREFSRPEKNPFLPLNDRSYIILYTIMNGNIRSTLSKLTDYCMWASDQIDAGTASEPSPMFNRWLRIISSEYHEHTKQYVRREVWATFDKIATSGGTINLNICRDLRADEESQLRRSVQELSDAGILTDAQTGKSFDDEIFYLTSEGWVVKYARNKERNKSSSQIRREVLKPTA